PERVLVELDNRIASLQRDRERLLLAPSPIPVMPVAAVRVFQYLQELDAFLPTTEYAALADELGLEDPTPIVWIGRLLTLDNNYGEHWFDNWEERQAIDRDRVTELGLDPDIIDQLLIIVPERFVSHHTDQGVAQLAEEPATAEGKADAREGDRVAERKAFWT